MVVHGALDSGHAAADGRLLDGFLVAGGDAASGAACEISKVVAGSRAERNGLEAGDRILVVNRQSVGDLATLRGQLAQNPPRLELGLARGRQSGYLQMR